MMIESHRAAFVAALALAACVAPRYAAVEGVQRVPGTQFTFTAPRGWMSVRSACGGVNLTREHPGLQQIFIDSEKVQIPQEPMQQILNDSVEGLGRTGPLGLAMSVGQSRFIEVDGHPAKRTEASLSDSRRAVFVFAIDRDLFVGLRYLAAPDRFERDLPAFESVLATFRFNNCTERAGEPPRIGGASHPAGDDVARPR